MFQREITRVRTVHYDRNSPNHKVGLVLSPDEMEQNDPFLLMAEDWFTQGTFPLHPHRGIETVTYVIEGKLNHFDNKAGSGELEAGDVQWMTAGSGVMHSEEPAPGTTVHTLQLWINLPAKHKMMTPRYQNLRSADMPVRKEDGAHIRVFSGSSKGVAASTKNVVPVTMVEMTLEPNAHVSQDLPGDYEGFLYILEGEGTFGKHEVDAKAGQTLTLGSAPDSHESELTVRAKTALKVLLYAGKPLKEPIVARGPFVMNTEEEIREAFRDLREGKFGN